MYLPSSRGSEGYEPLPNADDLMELKIERRGRNFFVSLAFVCCGTLLLVRTHKLEHTSPQPFHDHVRVHEHTLPTPLSIVDPVSRTYINSLENELYQELKGLQFVEHIFLHQTKGLPLLDLDKTIMKALRQPLTLSWTLGAADRNHSLVDSQDILALYCPANSDHGSFQEAATLEQAAATSRQHGGAQMNEWFIPSFPITKHESCEFRLFDRCAPGSLQLIAVSPTLRLPAAGSSPTSIHLALSNVADEMVIQFQTAEKGTPLAMYGVENPTQKVEGTSHTYAAADMCSEPANVTEIGKFQDPGMIHVVRIRNLEPDTNYFYKVGLASGQGIVWSDVYNFRSAPLVAPSQEPFSYIVYGDQGCPSVGWGPGGKWTSAMAAREHGVRAVHHFGDLAYAMGAAHIWDEWMHMIQSFAVSVPLMVGVGNHEYDYTRGGAGGKDPSGIIGDHGFMPEWGNFGDDSGGECGVPTSKRFAMPASNNSNGVFWYSYDFANVHTIMLSSEHNLTEGSVQYNWLLENLNHVNRSLTPWLVVELHRPLYQSEFFFTQNAVGVAMRYEIEDLLVEYKVDLVLSGHYHSYLRTCDGLYNSKCNNGGPMHICVGSAGAHLDIAALYPQRWTDVFIQQEWGYGRVTVANSTALHFAFVKAGADDDTGAGTIRDEVWVIRER